jgi:GTP-binding protein YchF
LADIQTIENRLQKAIKDAKAQPKMQMVVQFLQNLNAHLQSGNLASKFPNLDYEIISDLHLLTAKPVIYAFNIDEETLMNDSKKSDLAALVAPARAIFVCAKLEDEIKGLTNEDATELLESYGVKETGLLQMVHAAYDILGLQSYLTAGPKEVRAWTIHKGDTAPQAASVIHTDFERGFIAAQIVDYDDLIAAGSEVAAKSAGKVRTEGKEYVMRPGDVVEFRFNVSK